MTKGKKCMLLETLGSLILKAKLIINTSPRIFFASCIFLRHAFFFFFGPRRALVLALLYLHCHCINGQSILHNKRKCRIIRSNSQAKKFARWPKACYRNACKNCAKINYFIKLQSYYILINIDQCGHRELSQYGQSQSE